MLSPSKVHVINVPSQLVVGQLIGWLINRVNIWNFEIINIVFALKDIFKFEFLFYIQIVCPFNTSHVLTEHNPM